MPRSKGHPEKYRTKVRKSKEPEPSASLAQINSSFFHENSNDSDSFICKGCNKTGDNLILACNCPKEHYHPCCFKYQLREKVKNEESQIEEKSNYKYIKCKDCGYKIKFKSTNKLRCKSCSQACQTAHRNRCQFIFFIIFSLVFSGCLIYLVLLTCGAMPEAGMMMDVQRSALMIGLGIISGLLLIFVIYCLLDCVTISDVKIEYLPDRKEKAPREKNPINKGLNQKKLVPDQMVIEDID